MLASLATSFSSHSHINDIYIFKKKINRYLRNLKKKLKINKQIKNKIKDKKKIKNHSLIFVIMDNYRNASEVSPRILIMNQLDEIRNAAKQIQESSNIHINNIYLFSFNYV